MSAISASSRVAEPHTPETTGTPIHDVTASVKSWGRTGIILGANFGIVLGAIFVAIPFSTDVLTFGVFGTLLVGAVECAVIGGAFAASAAAIFANGVRGGSTAQYERMLKAGHPSGVDVPLAEWPARWTYPPKPTVQPLPRARDEVANPPSSLRDAQARLNTIDAWENGNTGP